MEIRKIGCGDKQELKAVTDIHLATFQGFFLTFMGRGFLNLMYRSYAEYHESGVLVAFNQGTPVGFLAYSGDLSGLYKYMIKKRLLPFAWYSLCAFFRKPKIFFRLVGAFLKPSESRREEKYVELASIGVDPRCKTRGIGSQLIDELKKRTDFGCYSYITLETDADDNERANRFYQKNGFRLVQSSTTTYGRKMNEYRFGADA